MTDILISNNPLAHGLAKTLGHGSVVVANSIQLAVWRAIHTEMNARVQTQAAHLGPINFLTPEEAEKAATRNDQQIMRPWDLSKARMGKLE